MKNTLNLIPLAIESTGEIITNNLPEFRELVKAALLTVNKDLNTDEDFGQAELDCRALKAAEDEVRQAALKAFDDKLKAIVSELNEVAEEIRLPRLELEKLIAKRKEDVKSMILIDALKRYDIDPATARRAFLHGLSDCIKGKRTIESMEKACAVYQTTTQAQIQKSREVIEVFERSHGIEMTMDKRELELRNDEVVMVELRRRLDAKNAAAEAAKLREESANASPVSAPVVTKPIEIEKPAQWPPEDEETAQEEWKRFSKLLIDALAPIRPARESLKHAANIDKAGRFATAFNAAWKEINA